MHSKTKRRLTILLAASVIAAGSLGGFVVYRKQHTTHMYAQLRQEGLAAYQTKDYSTALSDLGRYLGRYQTDSDILYACAQARLHLEESDRHEIPIALELLRRFVDLNPTRDDVRRQMLDLYLKVGFFTETIDTANTLLAKYPKDGPALRAKAFAQFGLRHYDDCLKSALQYNETVPEDLEGQVLTLADMQRRGASDLDILGRADKLLAQHPDDAHFQLLKSMAFEMTGDRRSAVPWAQKAAQHPVNDPLFYKALSNQLDSLGLYADADHIQELAAKLNPDPQTRDRWISRLVESGKYDQVLSLVSVDDPKSPATSVDLIVCRIIALIHLHRDSEAQSLQAILAERGKTDPAAAAAASAVEVTLLHPGDPQAAIAACNAALSTDVQNPFYLSLRSQAYERAGELELAINDLDSAARIAPSWAEPLVRESDLLIRSGRMAEAFVAAQNARARAPQDRDALIAVATAGIGLIPPDRTDEFKDLLTLLEQIEKRFPDEQRVLPIHAMVAFRLHQKDLSKQLAEKALDPHFNATQDTLLQLAVVSRIAGLGIEEACFNQCEKMHGMTPDLAFAKASWFSATNRSEQGLKFLADAKQKEASSSSEKQLDWDIAWARYLDLIKDPRAQKEWTALGDDHPKDIKLQWLALRAPSVQSDRPFIFRTIERLRSLRGDSGTLLALTRARYILQGNSSDKDLAEAVLLLTNINRQDPNVAVAHVLLASAYEREGNVSGAIDELVAAADLNPDNAQISLHLAKMMQDRGDLQRARSYVDRIAHGKNATPDDRRAIAALYMQAGDVADALQQMVEIPDSDRTDADKLQLASLYISQKQTALAEPLIGELLAKPSPQNIQVAADFYASQNRMSDADRVLAMLDKVDVPRDQKEMVRAGFLARYGNRKDAIKQYLEITKASPENASAWRQLLLVCLADGQLDGIAQDAARASQSVPADNNLKSFSDNLSKYGDLLADPIGRQLFASALQSKATDLPKIADALSMTSAFKQNKMTADQMVPKIRELAGRSADVLPIQVLAAQICLNAGQMDDAINIAMGAMRQFPTSVEAAQIATECLSAGSRWNEVVSVASQWRSRISGDPVQADIAAANACLRLKRPDQSRRVLDPYLQHALKTPEYDPGVLVVYAQSFIEEGRSSDAQKLLEPMLAYPQWRITWMKMAPHLPAEADAVAWLQRVNQSIPANAQNEKLFLAVAYRTLADSTKNAEYLHTAVSILEPLVERPDADAETCLFLGSLCEAEGNLPLAEKSYRHALAKNPNQPVALNNLAMVLTNEGTHTAEPLDLISRALQLQPNVPNFYDTQASILAGQKDFPKALTAIDQAIKLAPNNVEWHATRIWLLALSGQHAGALNEYRQYQLAQNRTTLPESTQKRLTAVGIE